MSDTYMPSLDIGIEAEREIVDSLFCQLRWALDGEPAFEAALKKGKLSPDAVASIGAAMDGVVEQTRRLQDIFIADQTARKEITRYMFMRAFAGARASAAHRKAFREAGEAI